MGGNAEPASAATPRNGVCEQGEICFYYLDNLAGSVSDFTGPVANYGASQPTCYEFKGPGAGQGLCMKDNVRSFWNRTNYVVDVWAWKGGYSDDHVTLPGQSGNLIWQVRDQNDAHSFRW